MGSIVCITHKPLLAVLDGEVEGDEKKNYVEKERVDSTSAIASPPSTFSAV